jgi:uncharacterized protein DUF3800
VFIAYIDESGTHDESEFASIAGYVDRSDGWAEFEDDWKAVLNRYVVGEFHMTDFESRHGEFAWRNYWFLLADADLRHPFLRDLINAINPPRRLRVGCTISMRDYHAIIPKRFKAKYHPYFFLFAKCVEQLWRVSFLMLPPGEQLAFVFDQKSGFEGRGDAIFLALKKYFQYSEKMGAVQFASSKVVVPLQAADLVAFEYRKYGEMLAHRTGRAVRWPMSQLCKDGARGLMHHISARSLKDWVARQLE